MGTGAVIQSTKMETMFSLSPTHQLENTSDKLFLNKVIYVDKAHAPVVSVMFFFFFYSQNFSYRGPCKLMEEQNKQKKKKESTKTFHI